MRPIALMISAVLCLVPMLSAHTVYGETTSDHSSWLEGLRLGAGYLIMSAVVATADGKAAMDGEGQIQPAISAVTPTWKLGVLGATDYGITVYAMASAYEVNRQTVKKAGSSGAESIDLGTAVRGTYAYVIPALTWEVDDPAIANTRDRFGIGLGYGYATGNGDAYLARHSDTGTVRIGSNGKPTNATRTDVNFSRTTGAALLVSCEFVYQRQHVFGFMLSNTPFLMSGGDNGLEVKELRMQYAYQF